MTLCIRNLCVIPNLSFLKSFPVDTDYRVWPNIRGKPPLPQGAWEHVSIGKTEIHTALSNFI